MKIALVQGDITGLEVDAIVNAANAGLAGGGGVDGAIHRAGGGSIMDECREYIARSGPVKSGDVVKTGAGQLKARYVFHAVGPIWRGGSRGEREDLASCYERALDLALELGCRTIAFAAITTGVYGFPKEEAVEIVRAVIDRRVAIDRHAANDGRAERGDGLSVFFVNMDRENHELYLRAFEGLAEVR